MTLLRNDGRSTKAPTNKGAAGTTAPNFPQWPVASVRLGAVDTDVDTIGRVGAVRLLGRGQDAEIGARLERARVADHVAHDRRRRADDDLLLAALVLDHDGQAVDAGDRRAGLAVGHGAVGSARPARAMPVAGAALGLGEDVHLDRLLAAVRLRHRA